MASSGDPFENVRSVRCQAARRVATVAAEVALALKLPGPSVRILEEAALHHGMCEFGARGLERLAAEVYADGVTQHSLPNAAMSAEAIAVLALLGRGKAARGSGSLQLLAEILRLSEMFDRQLEALPFEPRSVDALLDELQMMAALEGVRPVLVESLRGLRCTGVYPEIEIQRKLPVQGQLAQQAFHRLAAEREYEVGELEAFAVRDPVLAGSLIQVANSALYSPETRLGTVRQAIAYIGTSAARQVLLAAVMRPLFASAGLGRIWSHGVQMGQLCSALAAETGLLEAGAGLLLGLVHDIGSLAVHLLPRQVIERYQRFTERGACPPAYTERLFFGRDHGEIGADILDAWHFPEYLIEAVRFHHQPERSESAATPVLYLAEFWSGLDEDLPSLVRIQECSRATGLSLDDLASLDVRQDALNLLRDVA